MKRFSDLIQEQSSEVDVLRNIIHKINSEKIVPNHLILGALLTGSVARGDARIGPFGIMIDLAIVVNSKKDISLDEIFGADEKPFIPFHCVTIQDKIWLAIKTIEESNLRKIRNEDEPSIFAMNESIILDDKQRILKKWKEECFIITKEQIKDRALQNYFRFCYIAAGQYRFEKWSHREAWIQITQNFNEANECYCNFLYCINSMFIPRKDWLTYLTYEVDIKPGEHQDYMEKIYESQLNEEKLTEKLHVYLELKNWMEKYIKKNTWL